MLLNDPKRLSLLYRTIVEAGRDSGITVVELPDFLELDDGLLSLLGQDELADGEVEAALDPAAMRRIDPDGLIGEDLTTRLILGAARVGQHRFARDVLANCDSRCVFCGFEPGALLARRNLLRASHIKPWRDSTNRERLDVGNGLAACPNHDAAFDGGLLYVTDDLRIEVAPLLADAVASTSSMAAAFGSSSLAERLVLPSAAIPPDPAYLGWHRLYIVG